MGLIQYAIFGLVAGAIARLLHPGRDPMNWLWTMLLGIGGSMLGVWIAGMVGIDAHDGMKRWLAAIGGAVLLLALFHMSTARRPAVEGPGAGPATGDDYKKAVFDDIARGPNG